MPGLRFARLQLWLPVAGLCAIGNAVACSQQVDTLNPSRPAPETLARLRRGQRVRIRIDGDGLLEGRVVQHSLRFLSISYAGTSNDIPAARMDSLWVRGTRAGRGALIGATALGIYFGALGGSVCPGECNVSSTTGLVRGGIVGIIIGGSLGALIGTAVPHWQLRFP